MRTTLVASVVLMSLAGAGAIGSMLSTRAGSSATAAERPTPPAEASQHARVARTSSPMATVAALPPTTAATAPSAKPAALEAARPPVPLRVIHKPPLPENPALSDGKAGMEGTETPDKESDEKSQQAARAAIEADGYKGVQILGQRGNGVWKASALRGKTRVVVNVDQAGNVFTD